MMIPWVARVFALAALTAATDTSCDSASMFQSGAALQKEKPKAPVAKAKNSVLQEKPKAPAAKAKNSVVEELVAGSAKHLHLVNVTKHVVNATSQKCGTFDMWDTSHESPFQDVLKANFRWLSNSISKAINSKAGTPCKHVTISAGLFSETQLQGRSHKDEEVGKPAEYTGPAGCGFFIMNSWRAKSLEGDSGWHVIPFNADVFLSKIPENSKSNEIQRLYNFMKIAAPLYLPKVVEQITFGDEKCDLPTFSRNVEANSSPTTDIYTFAHPNFFHRSLMRELKETERHMAQRHELKPVFDDIQRLQKHLGDDFLFHKYELPEVMCMSWTRSKDIETFARRWLWYTASFTMRPQLTYNAALLDCGEALKVKYLQFIEPLIKN